MATRIAIEHFRNINDLIERRVTGTPAAMAVKVNCSPTTLFAYLAMMREMGAPIRYNRHKETYYYEEDGCFVVGFRRYGDVIRSGEAYFEF